LGSILSSIKEVTNEGKHLPILKASFRLE